MTKEKPKKLCCVNCFNEPEIQEFIGWAEETGNCNYCKSKKINVREVSEVADFLREGVERIYSTPEEEGVGWDDEEGKYHLDDELTNIEDILDDWGIYSLSDPTKLIADLGFHSDDTAYIRRDPYGPVSGGEEDIGRWENFSFHVKHNQRFTALIRQQRAKRRDDEQQPAAVLEEIARSSVQHFDSVIQKNSTVFRARRLKDNRSFRHRDLTSPPERLALNNRMSPAGISVFYGALDRHTAIAEVRPFVGEQVTIARFKVLKDLRVLDFSMPLPAMSPFSDSYSFHFDQFIRPFLMHFTREIAKPILPDDAPIDYVPTQIFTEYVKFLKQAKEQPIDGLIYPSSMKSGGRCLVLFRGPEISLPAVDQPEPWLRFKGAGRYDISGLTYEHQKSHRLKRLKPRRKH